MPEDHLSFKTVRDPEEADYASVCVTIFEGDDCAVCGWYLSPISFEVSKGYLPPSLQMPASTAVLRALSIADTLGCGVCIIDPDDLWANGWFC